MDREKLPWDLSPFFISRSYQKLVYEKECNLAFIKTNIQPKNICTALNKHKRIQNETEIIMTTLTPFDHITICSYRA